MKKKRRKRIGGRILNQKNQNLILIQKREFFLHQRVILRMKDQNEKKRRKCNNLIELVNRFKTLQQLLEEQNENAEETDFQPIVFTDHTGRKTKTRTLEESSLASVNRNAVGFEVLLNTVYYD